MRPRRLLTALLTALALAAALPAAASAHATLQESTPERGAALERPPAAVTLRFDEPVEVAFGAVRVFDAQGRRVDSGPTFHPGGRGEQVAVKLKGGLGRGGYTATYRVVSADSHPISGGFVFTVGGGTAPSATVDQLLGADAGPVTSVAFGAARAAQYAAIALGVGVLAFLVFAWLPGLRDAAGGGGAWRAASEAFAQRLRWMLIAAAVLGMVSGAAAIVLQGATAAGTSAWSALDGTVLGDVLATRFGLVWGLGVLAWAGVLAIAVASRAAVPALRPASVGATGLALPAGPGSWAVLALAVPVLALTLVPGLGGHAGVQSPRWLLLPANVLHVLAMGAWLGGVAVLVLALRRATSGLDAGDRTRLLAATVAGFSALAGVAIALLLLSGVVQSVVYVRTPANLVDTAFGRAVLIKFVLFCAIVALGYVNRRRLLPRLRRAASGGESPGSAGVLLRRVLKAELVLGVAVLAVTGALASYPPSTAVSAGPYSTDTTLGPARLEAVVDPARPGRNEMHLYLFERASGRPWDITKELSVDASLPGKDIAPIELEPRKAGPGHYVVTGASLGVAGDWTIGVRSRISEFDEYAAKFEVPVK
jgi:copper transport protein